MNIVIDNLDAVTGWTAAGGASIYGVNAISECIAGDLAGSLMFKFEGTGSYVEKIFTAIDVSAYDMLTLHVWSRMKGNDDYRNYTDFAYKIKFGATGKEYLLPVFSEFTDVSFDIADFGTIDSIHIEALTSSEDYLVVSFLVASHDEMPLDIYNAIKTKLENYIAATYRLAYPAGQIQPGVSSEDCITFIQDPAWIQRYSKILITDGNNSEYHHINKKSGKTVYFSTYFDSVTLKNSFDTGTWVYLAIDVGYGKLQTEIILPSITIWGFTPEQTPIESDVQDDFDSWKPDGSVAVSRTGQWFKYSLLIDCENDSMELVAVMSEIARMMIAQKTLWINGKRCCMYFGGLPTFIEPADISNNLPKIQYPITVEIKENVWAKQRVPKLVTETTTMNITIQ